MNTEEIRGLLAFNTWANHKILGACHELTAEEFTRDLGNSFRSIRDTLVHIMGAEWLWLQRWLGDSPRALLPFEDYPTLKAVEDRWIALQRAQMAFLASVTDERLEQKLSYINLKGEPYEYRVGTMIRHVVNHGSYHRGQVVTLLRQLGRPAPSTDLLRYIDEEPE
jgi:uncharacterized damage-inducible protein DinB